MDRVMNYLGSVEGTEIHRIESESDITAPYGIYRDAHPDADIFDYIDGIAEEDMGLNVGSSEWTQDNIRALNEHIESEGLSEDLYDLAREFYMEFLEGAHVEQFPKECVVSMFSMYTNSPANAWRAVQRSMLDIQKTGIALQGMELSVVDGAYGQKTERGLKEIVSLGSWTGYYMETLMLSNMKTIYANLAVSNPDKYLHLLRGWMNRMDNLQKMM